MIPWWVLLLVFIAGVIVGNWQSGITIGATLAELRKEGYLEVKPRG